MTIDRRALLVGLAAATVARGTRQASAQSWQKQYPELVYAVVPAENATGVVDGMRRLSTISAAGSVPK
jgi:phosphonate transport system substrate-binding protein